MASAARAPGRGRRSPRPRKNPPVSHLPDAFRAAVVYDLAGCRGGCRRSSARRRPSSIHCGIMLSSAPAAMHSWAARSLSPHRVSPRWRRARCPPPRPADPPGCPLPRGARSPRRFRARLAYASGMPLGYAGQAGNEQTVRGGSGAIMGHQARIEHVCDKGKLAKLVFRPRASRKDRRRRLSCPRRRTVCRHSGI